MRKVIYNGNGVSWVKRFDKYMCERAPYILLLVLLITAIVFAILYPTDTSDILSTSFLVVSEIILIHLILIVSLEIIAERFYDE